MKELIRITKSEGGKDVVSARELHAFLEATERFSFWMDRQLQYGFIEDVDYHGCEVFNALANQMVKDYAITIDCAKEISMLQRSEKGKEARLYFIARDKELRDLKQNGIPKTFAEALRLAADQAEKIALLEPKAEVYEQIAQADNLLTLNDAAKSLKLGRNKMMDRLRELKILRQNNTPYMQYIDEGYFKVNVHPIVNGEVIKNYAQTYVTGKGLTWLAKKLK